LPLLAAIFCVAGGKDDQSSSSPDRSGNLGMRRERSERRKENCTVVADLTENEFILNQNERDIKSNNSQGTKCP